MGGRGRGPSRGADASTHLPPPRRSGGARGWPSGGRTAPASSGCGMPRSSRSTPLAAARASPCPSSVHLRRPRLRRAPTASWWPSVPAARRPACCHWPDSRPLRAAGSTRSSPASSWRRGPTGRDLDLATLIQQVQTPPFTKVGVVDLEAFFPAKERFDLAMQLNGLLAAPASRSGSRASPLDPASLLYSPKGKPRVAVFSIAHLGDAERMFFVSLLLNQIVAWMRGQTGTTSLRAVLYMDEILGYFPPVATPPSKGAADDPPEAGPCLRAGRRAGDAEPRRSGLQGALEYRHLVPWPAPDRT